MPAPVIIAVVVVGVIYMLLIVAAVTWPRYLGPDERRAAELAAERTEP